MKKVTLQRVSAVKRRYRIVSLALLRYSLRDGSVPYWQVSPLTVMPSIVRAAAKANGLSPNPYLESEDR